MPLPELDTDTGCLPATPLFHDATEEEVREAFVLAMPLSWQRPRLFEVYAQHNRAWKPIVGQAAREQWMDGSFTTGALEPNDLDLVMWFPAEVLNRLVPAEQEEMAELFKGADKTPGAPIHAFCASTLPSGHPHKQVEDKARAYWSKVFGQRRDGVPKGIVRLWIG